MLILQMFRQIWPKVAAARLQAPPFPPSLDYFTFLVFSGRSSLLSGINNIMVKRATLNFAQTQSCSSGRKCSRQLP